MNGIATETTPLFDTILSMTQQLSFTERIQLLSRLAIDIEQLYTSPTELLHTLSYAQQLDLAQKKVHIRLDAIEKLYGSLMHIIPSSDDFASRKQEEIDLEEHHLAHRGV